MHVNKCWDESCMHDFEVMLAISPSLEKSSSDCPRLRCDEMHICY